MLILTSFKQTKSSPHQKILQHMWKKLMDEEMKKKKKTLVAADLHLEEEEEEANDGINELIVIAGEIEIRKNIWLNFIPDFFINVSLVIKCLGLMVT